MFQKVFIMFVLLVAVFAVVVNAQQKVVPYDVNAIKEAGGTGAGHAATYVQDDGDDVIIRIFDVHLTPIGVNTMGKDLTAPADVELFSGIMDAAGTKKPFVVAPVVNGNATFRIPNTARVAKTPVVEHIWGRGNDGKLALVHDPSDPWVVSKDGDLNTLAIGLVMYPNGSTKPLKSLGKGKLDQGKHPELQ